MMDMALIKTALSCKCPKCGKGSLYPSRFDFSVNKSCSACNLDFGGSINRIDGQDIFLIFFLGLLLVPFAISFDSIFAPPLWMHAVIWSMAALALSLGAMRPLKSCIIALQYNQRPGDLKK